LHLNNREREREREKEKEAEQGRYRKPIKPFNKFFEESEKKKRKRNEECAKRRLDGNKGSWMGLVDRFFFL